MIMADIKRIEYAEDPERCEALIQGSSAPCGNKRYPGSKFCLCHGGNKARDAQILADTNLFRVTQYQARIERMKTHTESRGLYNEIGILRMLLEEKLNQCTSDVELIIQSQAISDLVLKIERVVTSMHKLEATLGNYMSKGEILGFAQRVVGLLSDNVTDPVVLDKLASGILSLVGDQGKQDADPS
jgi:hypothetical protein